MATSIIRAGGTGVPGVQTTGGDDGALVLRVGPLASPVDALSITTAGAGTFSGSVTATSFSGPLTGNITGNTSGTAATVTTAAQPAITSVGTLTSFRSTGIDDNADALAITIDSSENVGIGTTTMNGKFNSVPKATFSAAGTTWAEAALSTAGAFGGGLSMIDGSAGYILSVQDSGATFTIRQGTVGSNPAERIRIDSAGNVGIGTATPSSYGKFTVDDTNAKSVYIRSTSTNFSGLLLENTNSSTKWQIGVEGGAFNTAGKLNIGVDAVGPALVIDTSRNVGIGTAYTALFNSVGGSTKLAVVGDSASTAVIGNTDASISIINKNGTLGNTAGLHFARADTDENPNYAGASIVAQFLAAQVTGEYPATDMNFLTSTSQNSAPSSKMTLKADGKLGIGTASPSGLLQVGPVNSTETISVVAASGGASTIMRSTAGTLSSLGSSNNVPVAFLANNQEYMRILTNGNVGIGTITSAGDTLRFLDVQNSNAGASAGAIVRLITSNVAGSGTTSVDMVKYKTGGFILNNNESNAAAYTSFNVNGEKMRITSAGSVGIGTIPNGGFITGNKLEVNSGTLGTTATNISSAQLSTTSTGNLVTLQSFAYRTANGSDHTTAEWRTQRVVDVTRQSYVGYGSTYLSFGTNATEQMRMDSSGRLLAGAATIPASAAGAKLYSSGSIAAGTGFYCKAGTAATTHGNQFNINFTGGVPQLWIDTTNLGTISISSDYRIKRNISTQTAPALNRIMALRPVTYQMADYGTLFKSNDAIKEGFIAHEVQEIIPSGADGVKDDQNEIQSLKVDAILAVVVKAMQEQQVIIQEQQVSIEAFKTRLTTLEG